MNATRKPPPAGDRLSASQIGKIGESLAASQLMLASRGRLAPFLPLADDDGVDLLLLDKVTAAALAIQVKSRTRVDSARARTVEFNVRRATFAPRAGAYTLCLLLDAAGQGGGQGVEAAWLLPNTELEAVSSCKTEKLVLTPSAKAGSRDRYAPYRCADLAAVCDRLLAALDRPVA